MRHRERMIKCTHRHRYWQETHSMATFVQKKVESAILRNFILLIQQTKEEEPQWKTGPYVEYYKINGVTVSYWEGEGALILHGPRSKTQELNGQIAELRNNSEGPTGQQKEKRDAMPKTEKGDQEIPEEEAAIQKIAQRKSIP